MSLTTTQHASPNASSPMAQSAIAASFGDMMSQFLEAMHEVFPECFRTTAWHSAWKIEVEAARSTSTQALDALYTKAITGYAESMSPYFARCIQHDDLLLNENIDIMHKLNMRQKWSSDLHDDTKAAIWGYILKLNEYANLYTMCSAMPKGIMSSLQTMALTVSQEIGDGQMNMSELNTFDFAQRILGSINPDDLESLKNTITEGDPATLCTMMTSTLNSLQL